MTGAGLGVPTMEHLPPRRLLGVLGIALVTLPLAGPPRQTASARVSWEYGWPMVGHDPQQTARSLGDGPRTPRLLWTYRGLIGAPVIGPDGTMYGWTTRGLGALAPTGTVRWIVPLREGFGGPPALGPDSLLRVSGDVGKRFGAGQDSQPATALLAVTPLGRRAWTIRSLPWATVPRACPSARDKHPW